MSKTSKIRILIASALMAAAVLMTAVTASAALKTGDYYMTSSKLNLRKSASSTAAVLDVIPKQTFVRIKASGGDNWYKVVYGSNTGFVSGSYLKSPYDIFGSKYSAYVTTDMRLRTSPKMLNNNIIVVIPTGGRVFKISKVANYDFYKVYYNGKVGYLKEGYFRGDQKNTRKLARNVYLRKTPSSKGTKLAIISKGESVVVIKRYNKNWWQVRYGNKAGYVAVGYFVNDNSGSTGTARKLKTAVNLRSTRSTSSSSNILRVIPTGGTVNVLGSYADNWYRVNYNGTAGYIKGGYFA